MAECNSVFVPDGGLEIRRSSGFRRLRSAALAVFFTQSTKPKPGTDELQPSLPDQMSDTGAYRFLLLRHSGHESQLWFEYVVGCLLSTNAVSDLQKLNPFLTYAQCDEQLNKVAILLLRANRIVQTNKAIDATDRALSLVGKQLAALNAGALSDEIGQLSDQLQLELSGLHSILTTERAYKKQSIVTRAEKELAAASSGTSTALAGYVQTLHEELQGYGATASSTVDPRFLVFEFLFNLQLRSRQVDLVL